LVETMVHNPASVYGRTKSIVEGLIADCARAHGLAAIVLRYFNASGADADGEIGEEHDPETHLIPNALKAAIGLGGPMHLFGTDYPTPDGTCLRDYIHVSDLADAHVAALDILDKGSTFDAFNLGTGRPFSVFDIMGAVQRATGKEVPFITSPRRAGDVATLTADIGKACEGLGFSPKHSDIDTIVGSAWRFHKKAWGL
jgi:UDP-glucose 4-epimerase